MDVSTRKLRYFVAVAEELHFSRAAARLFVAQQALSKQVKELEDALGTQLLRRSTRSVTLTPAGNEFLAAARATLAALDAGVVATRRAGLGEVGTLALGFIIGAAVELTEPIVAAFTTRYPLVNLEMREYGFDDPSAGLSAGESDVALVRTPFASTDIVTESLFTEPLMAAVSANHPLAQRASVCVADLIELPIALGRSRDQVWQDFWSLAEFRGGRPVPLATQTSTQTEELQVVAAGRAISVTVASSARFMPQPTIRYLPIEDVAGSTVAVAWHRERRSPVVDQFVAVARAVRDREAKTVAAIEHPFEFHNEML